MFSPVASSDPSPCGFSSAPCLDAASSKVTECQAEPPAAWCATLGERAPESAQGRGADWIVGLPSELAERPWLAPTTARYEVDLFGPVAQGRLLLSFANGSEAVLAPDTHVRLGSLEVFFGRVLADLR